MSFGANVIFQQKKEKEKNKTVVVVVVVVKGLKNLFAHGSLVIILTEQNCVKCTTALQNVPDAPARPFYFSTF